MRKILLIVSSRTTGLNYYRQLMPHNHLIDNFEGFEIQQAKCDIDNFDNIPDDVLKNYQAVFFLRHISLKGNSKKIIDRCHSLGCKVLFDIDDYWRLPEWHAMYEVYKSSNYSKQVDEAIKYSDLVFTTNVWLSKQIKKLNQNVFILPNSCDTSLPQYRKVEIKNRRLRFGWIGGVYHLRDIQMMSPDFYKFYNDEECIKNAQICLGGYTVGQEEYKKIESEMTFNYKLDKDYKEYLLNGSMSMQHYMNDKPYKRLYGKSVETYMSLYNDIDVSLIPLADGLFNSCKSELKMIEAGVMGKACIVNEVSPYIKALTNRNSFRVSRGSTFYDGIKYFMKNRNAVQDSAEALTETINEKYNMEKINKTRCEIYNYYL